MTHAGLTCSDRYRCRSRKNPTGCISNDIPLLNNEIEVLKPMLKQLKPKMVIDLYLEVLPLKQAFQVSHHLLSVP